MYCPEIHHNVSIDYNNQTAQVGPCCISTHTPIVPGVDVLNSRRLVELRDINLKENRLTQDCAGCTNIEKHGGRSRRISQLEFYKDWNKDGLRGLDLHLGNLCNLSCVICGPHNSTTWISDAQKLNIPIQDDWLYKKDQQYNIDQLSTHKNLEIVHFWGGEPLMDNTHLKFLKQLDANSVLQNCRISYNTNGTKLPSADAVEYWTRASLVQLYFSIDDIGTRFEYQRTGAVWNDVVDNLNWYYNMPTTNHLFYLTTTWTYLNVYYLPELYDWQESNLKSNRFGDITQICLNKGRGPCEIFKLTSRAYSALEKKFAGRTELNFILNLIKIDDTHKPVEFFNYIEQLDTIRGRSYNRAHPEWAELLGM